MKTIRASATFVLAGGLCLLLHLGCASADRQASSSAGNAPASAGLVDKQFYGSAEFQRQSGSASEATESLMQRARTYEDLQQAGEFEKPRRVRGAHADYTTEARRARVRGVVVTETLIDAEGVVRTVRIIQELGSGLDWQTARTLCTWRFAPAFLDDVPVPILYQLTMNFQVR